MRAVVQRVHGASCRVDGELTGAIDQGLLVFLGIGEGDGPDERDYMIGKILGLRIFENKSGEMDRDVTEVDGGLLVIPQFTLYGDVTRGRRPSFHKAEAPGRAQSLYEEFLSVARDRHQPVEEGRFAEMMDIQAENDGPVTILIDSDKTF